MLLAPCLVEDRQSTVVLCSDSIDKSQCVWQCLVVHLEYIALENPCKKSVVSIVRIVRIDTIVAIVIIVTICCGKLGR